MRRTLVLLIVVFGGFLLLLASPVIFWNVWDGYHAPQAKRAVRAAVDHLVRGEVIPQLHLRLSVSQADLSRVFSAGYEVVGHDPMGMSLNGYEVMVRASNGDQYNFDVYKLEGDWQLYCCGHSTAEELKGPAEEKPTLSLDPKSTRRAARVFR